MLSGDKIRTIRLSRGLSQKQISDAVQCPKEYISRIENFVMVPSEELYEKIIKAIYSLPDRSKETHNKGRQRKEEVNVKDEKELQTNITEVVRGTNKK